MLRRRPSSELSAPYWSAVDEKQLLVQFCKDCENAIHFPRYACPECLSENLEWRSSAGKGAIYSYSVIRQHQDPAIMARVPVVVALIDLDEGVRLMSHVVNTEPEDVEIGARVEVAWEEAEGGFLPVYELQT